MFNHKCEVKMNDLYLMIFISIFFKYENLQYITVIFEMFLLSSSKPRSEQVLH